MTFIDDASRKTFVYFLKSKKSVLDCLKDFKAFAETQTGKQIKRLRTDNGLEYVNSEMEKFLRESYVGAVRWMLGEAFLGGSSSHSRVPG